jgi:hypothetical protein
MSPGECQSGLGNERIEVERGYEDFLRKERSITVPSQQELLLSVPRGFPVDDYSISSPRVVPRIGYV